MSTPQGYLDTTPTADGYYGKFGGSFVPADFQKELNKLEAQYREICGQQNKAFWDELTDIRKNFQGRPTPIGFCKNLTEAVEAGMNERTGGDVHRRPGKVEIWLKREDLNHTGAHKLNHCMGEALLAKYLGKSTLIAETGAGQHGVATATAAAYFGLKCEVHMGQVDIIKEAPNVQRMKVLGATVVPATHGLQTLKEAVDSAFASYLKDTENSFYAIGSVVGPHPFPLMVRDFQRVLGQEAFRQWEEKFGVGATPDHVVACCGGGSNAMGIFSAFIDIPKVKLHAVEPYGKSSKLGEHAAAIAHGSEGVMHGFNSIMLKAPGGKDSCEPAPVHSIASGLDYPSVGPEHAHLATIGRTEKGCGATDEETVKAFFLLARLEGIIPALESAHAVAWAIKLARRELARLARSGGDGRTVRILVNLSGRGDKDMDYVMNAYGQYADMGLDELLAP